MSLSRFPPRVIVAAAIAAILIGLATWALLRLPHLRGHPSFAGRRWGLAVTIATLLALLAAWVVFILPAYWD